MVFQVYEKENQNVYKLIETEVGDFVVVLNPITEKENLNFKHKNEVENEKTNMKKVDNFSRKWKI